jgi:hypothetical protein
VDTARPAANTCQAAGLLMLDLLRNTHRARKGRIMKSSLTGLLLTGALAFTAVPTAQARDGIGAGGAAALGVLGGLAVGSAIASSQNAYYPGKPVYRAPRPVYVEEVPACHLERRHYIDPYGYEHIRRVEVCE